LARLDPSETASAGDGYDVSIRLIAKALVDAGSEVLYLGERSPPR
jgi:methylmalonyl-CoA mutase cobalamin-binding subunit